MNADMVVYDSKYSSLSGSSQALVAKLIRTDKPSVTVRVASVTKQSGDSDCAIAYISHIANGLDPSLYIFNQAQMRQHLIEKKYLEPFPIL